jgi:hypothetical protein
MALSRPPAKTEQLITTDTPAWRDRLDTYAIREGLTRAAAIRRFIRDGIEREEQKAEEGAPFCSPQRKAAGWRCAAPCADAECVPEQKAEAGAS